MNRYIIEWRGLYLTRCETKAGNPVILWSNRRQDAHKFWGKLVAQQISLLHVGARVQTVTDSGEAVYTAQDECAGADYQNHLCGTER